MDGVAQFSLLELLAAMDNDQFVSIHKESDIFYGKVGCVPYSILRVYGGSCVHSFHSDCNAASDFIDIELIG